MDLFQDYTNLIGKYFALFLLI